MTTQEPGDRAAWLGRKQVVRAARRVLHGLGVDVVRHRRGGLVPGDFSAEERATWEFVRPFTMTSPERMQALVAATDYVVRAGLGGAFVECGVWRGGSMMAVARTLLARGDSQRDLHLLDTFAGMTPPTERDRSFDGRTAQEQLQGESPDKADSVWCVANRQDVEGNLAMTGYPREKLHFVQGPVEHTLPAAAPDRVALLRVDTDWFESTRHSLVHLYPRLVPGGVLLLDDYGHWLGAREAVDGYLREHNIQGLLQRIDGTGRLMIKPS